MLEDNSVPQLEPIKDNNNDTYMIAFVPKYSALVLWSCFALHFSFLGRILMRGKRITFQYKVCRAIRVYDFEQTSTK